ncbi:Hypothetical_protein [Hexamita inflata]|uniref:Hypothetical_protein n=1 Tax=Hexamita inflata TaxID=28002 RepID=A0AA86QH64_9EUKA|nr:Hypothetical protein HINF_LOCUS39190 [Hexamita inflata]
MVLYFRIKVTFKRKYNVPPQILQNNLINTNSVENEVMCALEQSKSSPSLPKQLIHSPTDVKITQQRVAKPKTPKPINDESRKKVSEFIQKLNGILKVASVQDSRFTSVLLSSYVESDSALKQLQKELVTQKILRSSQANRIKQLIDLETEYLQLMREFKSDKLREKMQKFRENARFQIATDENDTQIIKDAVDESQLYLQMLKDQLFQQKGLDKKTLNTDGICEMIQVEEEFIKMAEKATYAEFQNILKRYQKIKEGIELQK